jgi:hypothetical protein
MTRKRRTKAEIEASKLPMYEVVIDENVLGVEKISLGLGDTVEKVLEATGVSKVAKWLLGEDCGCDERKAKLNELFPYRKPLCLQKDEHEYLQEWFNETRHSMKPTEQKELLRIYNRVFKVNMQPTSCGSCLRDVMNKLEILFNTYEDANS